MIGNVQEVVGSYSQIYLLGWNGLKWTVQVPSAGRRQSLADRPGGQAQRGAGLELRAQQFAFKLYKSTQVSGKYWLINKSLGHSTAYWWCFRLLNPGSYFLLTSWDLCVLCSPLRHRCSSWVHVFHNLWCSICSCPLTHLAADQFG